MKISKNIKQTCHALPHLTLLNEQFVIRAHRFTIYFFENNKRTYYSLIRELKEASIGTQVLRQWNFNCVVQACTFLLQKI